MTTPSPCRTSRRTKWSGWARACPRGIARRKWVVAQSSFEPQSLLYPTGAGEPVPLEPHFDLTQGRIRWFSDSARPMLVAGRTRSRSLLRQRHHRGAAAAVTPENVTDAVLASDDRTLLHPTRVGCRADDDPRRRGTRRGEKFAPDDDLLAWTPDRAAVIVVKLAEVPTPVDRGRSISGANAARELGAGSDGRAANPVGLLAARRARVCVCVQT